MNKKILIFLSLGVVVFGGISFFIWKNFSFFSFVDNVSYKYIQDMNLNYKADSENQNEENNQENIESFDFYSDDSIQKFLDNDHALSIGYKANDIVNIISDFTSNQSNKFYLRAEAAENFANLARAFSNAFDFKSHLTINSAWRSSEFQRELSANCSKGRCANPGTSEHEAGLAVDLGVNGGNIKSGNGKYYKWLKENAHLYGFHNTYQKGVEIDGKIVEPRHRRYLGVKLATILYENNLTFAEYFYSVVEPKKIQSDF